MDEVNLKKLKIRRIKYNFELDERSRKPYRELERNLETVVNGIRVETPLVLSVAMKLQQITGGFLIESETRRVLKLNDSKLQALTRILKRRNPGEPWIVIVRFIHEIEAIQSLSKQLKIKSVAISGKNEYDLDKCKNSDLIILQIASGVAIDLSVASTTVFYSWDYSYINYEQSKFRMIKFGKRQITYYYLIARKSIDGLFYESITQKKDLATLVCDLYRKSHDQLRNPKTHPRG